MKQVGPMETKYKFGKPTRTSVEPNKTKRTTTQKKTWITK